MGKENKRPIYLIHRHDASHLHFDLRLEFDGVLKSWAVPKEPSINPDVKRLAIQVDDHDLGYADFEGIIPKGSYGAGKVEIWDSGYFDVIDKKENKIIIDIHGKKLIGEFVLLKLKDGKNWLFFKKK